MVKEIKKEIKKEEPKTFNIPINGLNGNKFFFSGPEISSTAEQEQVVYLLLQHVVINNWKNKVIASQINSGVKTTTNIKK